MNTTPKCPGCGQAMELLTVPRYICNNCGWLSPYRKTWDRAEEAALRRYAEPNRVLSPEDLQNKEGEPVFIQQGDGDEYWSVVEGGSLLIGECDPDFQDMTCSFDKDGHFGLHVLGWRAWLRRPTDEERQTVAWEESE